MNSIERTMRRTQAYYYEDGFVELAIGGLFGLVAGGLLLMHAAQGGSGPLMTGVGLGLFAVVLGGALAVQRLVRAAKERVTYPRTGYVTYRPEQQSRGRWVVIAAATALALSALVLPEPFTQMPFVVGALLAIVMGTLVLRGAPPRLALAGAAGLGAGVGAALGGLAETPGVAAVFGVAGAALAAGGALALAAYLRRAPVRHEADGE